MAVSLKQFLPAQSSPLFPWPPPEELCPLKQDTCIILWLSTLQRQASVKIKVCTTHTHNRAVLNNVEVFWHLVPSSADFILFSVDQSFNTLLACSLCDRLTHQMNNEYTAAILI